MVFIKPFKAIRPPQELAAKVATLPYDVVNSAEAAALAKDNPYSYLHIDRAEIDLPQTVSPYSEQVYQQAANALAAFREKKWLLQEETPALYLYELTMNGRAQTGLVTCTSVQDYLDGNIKKHEFTRVEKEIDRINHSDACDANTSPIFLTYRGQAAIQEMIHTWKETHQPLYDFMSYHDVRHRVWIVNEPQTIEQLTNEFQLNVPALYIADGHHRTESAVKVGKKRQAQFPNAPQDAEFHSFLSVLFPKEELEILAYNRVLKVPLSEDFMDKVAAFFSVKPIIAAEAAPTSPKTFGMYLAGAWYQLTIKDTLIPKDAVGQLDVALLQTYVFEKLFAIRDIRTDQRIDFVGGIRGQEELAQLVDQGDYTLAFSLFPTSMDDLLAVADAGEIMPPKSTWFEPKLLSGLFLHSFETSTTC